MEGVHDVRVVERVEAKVEVDVGREQVWKVLVALVATLAKKQRSVGTAVSSGGWGEQGKGMGGEVVGTFQRR